MIHPWLVQSDNSANCVQVDNHEELFGSHPNDSVEVISDMDLASDQSGSLPEGLSAYHIAIVSGTLSSDEEDYCSDSSSRHQPSAKKRSMKLPVPSRLPQSKFGRIRAKVGAPQEWVHGRIFLTEYTTLSASSNKDSVPSYKLLISRPIPTPYGYRQR